MKAQLGVRSFRSFTASEDVLIRPLTLFYGRNQSGKSSMLRLLVALGEALREGSGVFPHDTPALAPAGFDGSAGGAPPTLRLTSADGRSYVAITYAFDTFIEPNRIEIGNEGRAIAKLSASGNGSRRSGAVEAHYDGTLADAEVQDVTLTFRSLLPEAFHPAVDPVISMIREQFAPLLEVQWLAMTRPTLPASAGRPVRWCLPDGSGLAAVVNGNAQLRGAVEARLRGAFDLDILLQVHEQGNVADPAHRFAFTLSEANRAVYPLDRGGEGMRWLVPMVATMEWARQVVARGDEGPRCLAIEEPEARLHPKLQVPLAHELFRLAREGVPCIVETHSVYMLRALQLAVATGELSADDVALHWFEDGAATPRVRHIEVERNGALVGWRPDVFEEEQLLDRELFTARWRQREQP